MCRTMRIKWMMKCWFLHKSPHSIQTQHDLILSCYFLLFFIQIHKRNSKLCFVIFMWYCCRFSPSPSSFVVVVISITIAIDDAIAMHIVYGVHDFRVCRVNYAESSSHLSKINEIVPKNRKFKSIQYWMCVSVWAMCVRACRRLHTLATIVMWWWQMFLYFPFFSSAKQNIQPHTISFADFYTTPIFFTTHHTTLSCMVYFYSVRESFLLKPCNHREESEKKE